MGIIECKKCGNLIEQDDVECSVCGAKASSKETATRVKTVRITKIKKKDEIESPAHESAERSQKIPSVTKTNSGYQDRITVGGVVGIVFISFVMLIGARVFFFSEDSSPSVSKSTSRHATAPKICKDDDIQCRGEKYRSTVLPTCINLIEQRATYSFRWIDGLSNGPKLKTEYMTGMPPSVVIYSGRNIEMQNGFGAWKRMYYQCWFDTAKMSIVHVVLN